jgi:hypothetical protein
VVENFAARFARAAKVAEKIVFSWAIERTAQENLSALITEQNLRADKLFYRVP